MYLPSEKIKVYAEVATGEVFTGTTYAANLNISTEDIDVTGIFDKTRSYVAGPQSWELILQGIGSFEWIHGASLAPGIVKRFLPREWQCEYCERANPLSQYQCQSCGWYRGLLVDVAQEAGVWRFK